MEGGGYGRGDTGTGRDVKLGLLLGVGLGDVLAESSREVVEQLWVGVCGFIGELVEQRGHDGPWVTSVRGGETGWDCNTSKQGFGSVT